MCGFPRNLIVISSCSTDKCIIVLKTIILHWVICDFAMWLHTLFLSIFINTFFLNVKFYYVFLKFFRMLNKEFSALFSNFLFLPLGRVDSYFGTLFWADMRWETALFPIQPYAGSSRFFFLYSAWELNISFISSFLFHMPYNSNPKIFNHHFQRHAWKSL